MHTLQAFLFVNVYYLIIQDMNYFNLRKNSQFPVSLRDVNKIFVLLVCYAVYIGKFYVFCTVHYDIIM